jgi:hypothetical protein
MVLKTVENERKTINYSKHRYRQSISLFFQSIFSTILFQQKNGFIEPQYARVRLMGEQGMSPGNGAHPKGTKRFWTFRRVIDVSISVMR